MAPIFFNVMTNDILKIKSIALFLKVMVMLGYVINVPYQIFLNIKFLCYDRT